MSSTLPEVDWDKLSTPFPDAEVKHRPGAAKWDHKPSCEGARCRVTRDPEMHIQFSYVDARAVAQRLDEVLTPLGWDFTCAVIPGTDVVKGTLRIGERVREDHGYPNSDRDEEPIKAATSDALKRCAVLFGVGRHLYEDNSPSRPTVNGNRTSVSPSARPAQPRPLGPPTAFDPSLPSRRSGTDIPEEFGDLDWDHLSPAPPNGGVATMTRPVLSGTQAVTNRTALSEGEGLCPVHGVPWVLKPAGVSKTGAPYDPFFACASKEKPWCKEKPTRQWAEAHHP